eukprot:6262445-Pyramimonas_sp.AAC.1
MAANKTTTITTHSRIDVQKITPNSPRLASVIIHCKHPWDTLCDIMCPRSLKILGCFPNAQPILNVVYEGRCSAPNPHKKPDDDSLRRGVSALKTQRDVRQGQTTLHH